MSYRVSLLFSVTTNPTNLGTASAHSGGWSESHWSYPSTAILPYIRALALVRSPMLPSQASIIGYRIQNYTITGNKLFPVGSTSGGLLYPGGYTNDMNLPQDGVTLTASGVAVPNATRFTLRGLPDSQIANGEYQPSTAFATAMNTYCARLVADGWGFIGRVKTGLSARVLSIDQNTGAVTLNGPVGGQANVDFLRLNRVYDEQGIPLKGAFLITAIAGNVYTCPELKGYAVSKASGTARIDALSFYSYASCQPQRAASRKIGRPFQGYRGRRSRQRTA